jgi:N-acetylglucosamine-6-phosphate deacetylase
LAPERTDHGCIRALAEAGVVVAAGHTDATYEQALDALAAGVTGFTHLFNAMSPLASRAPGAVGAALEDQSAFCGIIVDGRHIHPAVLRLALRCRPLDRFMLVTDAMPSVGLSEKTFILQGRTNTVEDGVCVGPDGTLAGSDLDMASAVRNAVEMLGVDPADALRMASLAPAQFLGLDHELGRIAPGLRADLALLDPEGHVVTTWIGGQLPP